MSEEEMADQVDKAYQDQFKANLIKAIFEDPIPRRYRAWFWVRKKVLRMK